MPITEDTIENIKAIKDPLLRKRYAYLWQHPQIKEVFFSVESADIIFSIAQKYHLGTEKMQCLARTAGLVLLGEIPIDQFESEIQKQCGFIPESARDIAKDIDERIFSKIKQFLPNSKQAMPNGRQILPSSPPSATIKQELAEHGVEIKETKLADKYREPIPEA